VKASDYDLTLEELSEASAGRLLVAQVFDLNAFSKLKEYLSAKCEHIKAEHVVSKQVINALLSAAQAIENNAEHVPGARENRRLAEEFRFMLGLISIGEAPSDRQPGRPRIR
jgi:hypothetical protein